MIVAPTFSQIKAQVNGIRQKLPDARVIGIHADGRWTGEQQQYDGEQLYLIQQCDSPLALRIALQASKVDHAIRVFITPLKESDLESDILLRFAKQRLFVIDEWQIVKSLFRASNIDPRLLKHQWMAEALMEWVPANRYFPVLGGFLDAEIVWPLLLQYGIGLSAVHPDLPEILQWSVNPDYINRYRDTSDDFRIAACEWLTGLAGPAVKPILDCVAHSFQPDALPLGLAAEVVYHFEAGSRLDKAIGKLEERFLAGQSTDSKTMQLWSEAARQTLSLITDSALKQKLTKRSDEILTEIGANEFAYLSSISEQGFNQRLTDFSNHLIALVKEPNNATLDQVRLASQRVKCHQFTSESINRRRLERMEMALRLSRWLAHYKTTPQSFPADLEAAIDYHVKAGGFLDWARLTLRLAEPHRELSIAYAKLFDAVTAIREEQSHQFAKLLKDWTAIGSTCQSVLPVEHILETVLAPIDEKIPILLIVLDGMSLAVSYELLSDFKNQNWRLLRPESQPTAITAGLATLPSTTEVSRTSFLCSRLQQGQANHEKQGFANNPFLLKRCKRTAPPLLFHKASLQSADIPILSEDVHNAIESDKNRVVGVILNAVDDLLSKGDQVDTHWTFDQIKILLPLLQSASNANRLVILTSDHGHVLHTNAQYQSAQGGERWRLDDGKPTEQELQLTGERVVLSGSKSLIAPWTERVRYCSAKKNGYHGGITPQEMIVPIAVIAPTNFCPNNWQEAAIQYPTWWEQGDANSQSSINLPQQNSNEYANLGPLFSFTETTNTAL